MLAFALVGLTGCIFSDTITEVIYEQDEAYEIDYDAPKIYINSPDGDTKSDDLPLLEAIEEGRNDVNDLPDYDGNLSDVDVQEATQAGAGEQQNDETGEGNDMRREQDEGNEQNPEAAEAPEAVAGNADADARSQGESDSQASRDNPSGSGEASDKGEANTEAPSDESPGTGPADGGNDGSSDQGGGKTDGDANAGNGGENPNDASNTGQQPGQSFYDDAAYDDLPTGVHTVAAVGNAAIIAAALGGADGTQNLVAADADLLGSKAATVLKSKSISSVASCWSGDGTASGSVNLTKLREQAPDAVIVTEGTKTLSEGEQATLKSDGVEIVFVPAITSAERAKKCVLRIGALLGKGDDADAASLAEDYESFHDGIAADCADSGKTYTLYVTTWRSGKYSGSYKSSAQITGGAFAPGGAMTPVLNDYLSLSGVVNTPSVNARYSGLDALAIVWPYTSGTRDSDWSGITNVNGGLPTTGNGFKESLTRYTENSTHHDLGSKTYPALICKTKSLKKKISDDRALGDGLYSSGGKDKSIVSDDYGLYVNPSGLFCSWVDGSMESILETAWAHKKFKSDDKYYEGKLDSFYKTFYGYTLTSDDKDLISSAAYTDTGE